MSMSKRESAKRVQSKQSRKVQFPTDEESVVLRQKNAEKEAAEVCSLRVEGDFFGEYQVASAQWETPYLVEIRSLNQRLNTCSCEDFNMNRLGTCKHIERVLQKIVVRRKRLFAAAAKAGSPCYEVFFDTRESPPVLRLLEPSRRNNAAAALLRPLFSADGTSLASPLAAVRAIEFALSSEKPATRKQVRLSQHAERWIRRLEKSERLVRLHRAFDADVASGKRRGNPVKLPLYDYQRAGMLHLAFKGRALLADEMGLGKTVQAIAAAELLRGLGKVRRVLIVCPASLKAEWEEQLDYFTGIEAKLVYGLRSARLRTYSEEHAYAVMNYEQVRNDVDEINELMLPDLVILDEAQRIKNWPTKTAKTIKRLQSPYAFVLTGTPLENRIEELYSLVEFIDPQVFGSLFRFEREYMQLDAEGRIGPKNLPELHRRVSEVMLRRRKHDVETTLPERTDKTFTVPMTAEQRNRYEEYALSAARLASIAKRRPLRKEESQRLLLLLGCMRMLCDTPYILDQEVRDCPKLEELEQILRDALDDPETKIIIFSEWVRMLDLVGELLTEMGVGYVEHTGKIPQVKRREKIRQFKDDPECRVFLSSDSGGTGLNLQVASIVVNLDLPWNPAKLEQRIARAWRKHQEKPVRVVNIVSENSIEEAMLEKLAYKAALADAVLDGTAFEESLSGEKARISFVDRVRELLGDSTVAEAADAPKSEPVQADFIGVLQASHPQHIAGVERMGASDRAIIVARSEQDADVLRDTMRKRAKSAGPGPEVISAETQELLRRLAAQGLLQLAPELTASFKSEGYTPLSSETVSKPKRHHAAARKHWRGGAQELAAVRALLGAGLADPAMPHLSHCIALAGEALGVLYTGDAHSEAPSELWRTEHAALGERLAGWNEQDGDAEAAAALVEEADAVFCQQPT